MHPVVNHHLGNGQTDLYGLATLGQRQLIAPGKEGSLLYG